jgi:hypothetical protein
VLLSGVAPELLRQPVNVVRVSLHPLGLGERIVNFVQWRRHILSRIEHQIEATGDGDLRELLAEVAGYPVPQQGSDQHLEHEHAGVVLPLRLRTDAGTLGFISTVTVFGTPQDITLQELAVESFFPADELTARVLSGAAG